MTNIAANIPKVDIGIIVQNTLDMNPMKVVKVVVIMAVEDFLKVYVILLFIS